MRPTPHVHGRYQKYIFQQSLIAFIYHLLTSTQEILTCALLDTGAMMNFMERRLEASIDPLLGKEGLVILADGLTLPTFEIPSLVDV